MTLAILTFVHVLISLVAIAAGFVVMAGFLGDRRLPRWTAVFLAMTFATSATGFLFPFVKLLPSHVFGVISLAVLVPTLHALYRRNLAGSWRWIYVAGATLLLYLNVFVLVVQIFLKIPFFNALAPTQAEPPFAVAQGLVFLLFIAFGIFGIRRFRGGASHGKMPAAAAAIG